MRFYRSERVESLIQKELGAIMARELEFNGALVTIMSVEIDKKMDHADIRVSVVPETKEDEVMRTLSRAAGQLQYILLRKINIKPMPRIAFSLDHGADNAARVERAFLEAEKEGEPLAETHGEEAIEGEEHPASSEGSQ